DPRLVGLHRIMTRLIIFAALAAIVGIVWGIGTIRNGQAEDRLGNARVSDIKSMAHAIVNDYYAHPTRDRGEWGVQTCNAWLVHYTDIGNIDGDVERVWKHKVSDYWHERATSRADYSGLPSLATIDTECS